MEHAVAVRLHISVKLCFIVSVFMICGACIEYVWHMFPYVFITLYEHVWGAQLLLIFVWCGVHVFCVMHLSQSFMMGMTARNSAHIFSQCIGSTGALVN